MDIKNFITKNRKTLLIVFAVIIVFLAFYFILKNKIKSTEPKEEVDVLTSEQQRCLEVAEEVISWIDNHRSDKMYITSCNCVDYECTECEYDVESYRRGAFFILARTKYYTKNPNEKDLRMLNEDVDFLLNTSAQINSWHCKLLRDISHDDALPQETRDKIYQVCVQAGYEISTPETDKEEEEIIEKILSLIEVIKNGGEIDLNQEEYNEFSIGTFTNASLASEFITRYEMAKEEEVDLSREKKEAITMFLEALNHRYILGERMSVKNNAILGVATLDMYNLYQDETYLDFAKYLFDVNDLMIKRNGFSSYPIAYHLFFLKELFKVTEDELYNVQKEDIISQLIQPELIGNQYMRQGLKGIYFYDCQSLKYYSVIDNALLISLLLEV